MDAQSVLDLPVGPLKITRCVSVTDTVDLQRVPESRDILEGVLRFHDPFHLEYRSDRRIINTNPMLNHRAGRDRLSAVTTLVIQGTSTHHLSCDMGTDRHGPFSKNATC